MILQSRVGASAGSSSGNQTTTQRTNNETIKQTNQQPHHTQQQSLALASSEFAITTTNTATECGFATTATTTGYSHQIAQITRGKVSLDDFEAPDSCSLDPVQHDEFRHTVDEGDVSLAFIVNRTTGERRAVLPRDVMSVRMLILSLDEGSPGTAGVAAAAFQQKKTVWGKFDKIHRIIRDLKLAEDGCCGKVFSKAKLWSSYLYGLNNRPFGSGANHTLKERLLYFFQLTESVTSATFQKYVSPISNDFGIPCDSMEDQQRIFNKILEMKSFTHKLGQPKLSNWFAWNAMAHEQIPEFNATKCVFASTYPLEADPDDEGPFDLPTKDPKAQLHAILKGGGGVPLAFQLMKSSLNTHVKIMYVAENASWDFYTQQIKDIKSPTDACQYSLRMADRGWQSEPHLWDTLAQLQNSEKLRFMEIPMGESVWATRSLLLSWNVVMRRSWSLAKHSAPPESLSGLLDPAEETRTMTANKLKAEHQHFLLLERRALTLDDAAHLRKDIIFLDSPAVRVVFEFYARDKYDPMSASGRQTLRGHIVTLADNKIVEDIHQPLRLNARANINRKLSFRNIQKIILASEVLEKRGIAHPSRVDKRAWVANFKRTRVRATSNTHHSYRHKLPKAWSRMMKPGKNWHTISEETLQRAAAAWVWLHTYMDGRGRSLPDTTLIGDAMMSKWVPKCVILTHNVDGGQSVASFGNRVWGALGLPLQDVQIDGVVHYKFARTPVVWLHIASPSEWGVLPFVAVRAETHGVVMKPTDQPQSLVKHMLSNKNTNLLTHADLQRLVNHLGVQPATAGEPTTAQLISYLAFHSGGNTADWICKFQHTEDNDNCLMDDPFAEASREHLHICSSNRSKGSRFRVWFFGWRVGSTVPGDYVCVSIGGWAPQFQGVASAFPDSVCNQK